MYKGFDTVDRDHGNVVLIFSEQFIIRFDIYFFQREPITAASVLDRDPGFVAKMTAWTRIDDHMSFRH